MLLLCYFQVEEGCNFELQMELLETVCHTVNPKHFEDCEIREETDWVNVKQLFMESSSLYQPCIKTRVDILILTFCL